MCPHRRFHCIPAHLYTGSEGKHEATLPDGGRGVVPSLSVRPQVQETPLHPLLLPLSAHREEKVPHAGLEHHLRLQ